MEAFGGDPPELLEEVFEPEVPLMMMVIMIMMMMKTIKMMRLLEENSWKRFWTWGPPTFLLLSSSSWISQSTDSWQGGSLPGECPSARSLQRIQEVLIFHSFIRLLKRYCFHGLKNLANFCVDLIISLVRRPEPQPEPEPEPFVIICKVDFNLTLIHWHHHHHHSPHLFTGYQWEKPHPYSVTSLWLWWSMNCSEHDKCQLESYPHIGTMMMKIGMIIKVSSWCL